MIEKKKRFFALFRAAAIVASVFLSGGGVKAGAEILKKTDVTIKIEAMGKIFEFSYPEVDFSGGELYLKNAEEAAEEIYYSTLVFPVNASFICFPERDYPFELKNEKAGLGVDKREILRGIDEALKNEKHYFKVEKTVEVLPRVTTEYLKKTLVKRGEFSTNYSSSQERRKQNIALSGKLLSMTEIANGEEFSFNGVVGERTEERGFSSAKVIENGKFTEGVGGGVCQVSSTVYNCALLSGMTVTERHRHSLAVSYVEPSFDAMVSFSYADLRFLNESGESVYLVVDADGSRVRARIYGVENVYRYKRISVVNELIDPLPEEIVYTDELFEGEKKQMVYPKKGLKSAGALEKYSGEKLVGRKFLGTDEYSALRGITLVGKKRA